VQWLLMWAVVRCQYLLSRWRCQQQPLQVMVT
jgi:hypothetical protein